MADTQQLTCSCCKQEKEASQFSKCPTKRGYNYHCKACVNERTKEKRKQPISSNNQPSTSMVVSSNQSNNMVVVVMETALKYTSNFEQFVEVMSSFRNVVDFQFLCDVSFKYCRQHYPDDYKTLITTMLEMLHNDAQNVIQDDAQDALQNDAQFDAQFDAQNVIQNDAQNVIQNVSITKQYISQYNNDPSMIQVGDDIESDDENNIMTVRDGDEFCKVKVKKSS